MTKNTIKLKVAEALQDDVNKGIARIDAESMRELGIQRGDVISIKGNRETVAIVDRAYPADVGEGIIRIDGISRRNAKTGIGDNIVISKSDVKEAKKVTIAPAQKGIMIQVQGDPKNLTRGLFGRAVAKGDIIVLGGVQRRMDLLSDDFGEFNDVLGGMLDNFGLGGLGGKVSQMRFIVANTAPNQQVIITENTEVILNHKAVEIREDEIPEITYEDIGGLGDEVKKIREMVETPLKHPEIFDRLGVDAPKGVLLYGVPGTGKTLLAKAVANESEANFVLINGPEIFNKFYGESEKKIRDIFEEAEKNAPSIIFIDELDAVAPNRDNNLGSGEVERRVVSQLLTMMDGLQSRGKIIVIGATNRPDSIEPALRRPGRFDREIEINVPDKEGRLAILKIHTRGMPLSRNVNLNQIAKLTHGFVGADLEALTKEAAMNVLRKVLPEMNMPQDEQIPQGILEKLIVKQKDFHEAMKFVQPSALREVSVEIPNIGWNDVGGLQNIKEELKEVVEWPLKYPDSFARMGIKPSKGILIYGPPGTGKTLLAKAVAKESESNFIQINGNELQKEGIVGKETERLRKIFKRARQVAPCIVLFDEIDSFARRRGGTGAFSESNESLLNTLLTEMDGLEELKDVVVIAATNRPDMLDPALLRPGRFDRILLVNAPEKDGRIKILEIHSRKMPLGTGKKLFTKTERENFLKDIAEKTMGYTGADLEGLTHEAAMLALRESVDAKQVTKKHFEEALKKIKPSVNKPTIEVYKKIEDNFLKSAKSAVPVENSYLG